jgi:hypothetical protein
MEEAEHILVGSEFELYLLHGFLAIALIAQKH